MEGHLKTEHILDYLIIDLENILASHTRHKGPFSGGECLASCGIVSPDNKGQCPFFGKENRTN